MNLDGICLNCFSRRGAYDVCPYCGYLAGTVPAEGYILHPGSLLRGRYVVGTVLGAGGFGITYRAWDTTLNILVAIKEFFPQSLVSRIPGEMEVRVFSGERQQRYAGQLARFMDEARNMARFAGDAHIVNVFDFFEAGGTAYIVMEYLDGVTLKQHMAARGGSLPAQEALAVTYALLGALEIIHQKDIIHRDISPDNIFILRDGRVKVLDFGAARFGQQDDPYAAEGVVIKVGYAPPEQYRGNMRQGVWTDIYATGATLYKMLTGVTPEESVDRMERDTLRRPSQIGHPTEPYIEKVIMKAMALKPDLRFKSAGAMLAALENRTGAEFPEEELRRRKRNRAALVALAVVALAVVGGIIGWQASRPKGDTLAGADIAPDSIEVCIPDMGDETTAVYKGVVEAFAEQYPDHRVSLTVKPYDAFMQMAGADLGTTRAPAVIQSVYFDPEPLTQAADLSLLANSLDAGAYWFLKDYERLYPNKVEMPTGLNVMVGFADTRAVAANGGELPGRFSSVAQIGNLAVAGSMSKLALSGGDAAFLLQLCHPGMMGADSFSAEGLATDTETLQWLYNAGLAVEGAGGGEIPIQISWANQLRTVQDRWPGHYAVLPMEGPKGMLGTLSGEWMVNAAVNENQQQLGMLFIHFLLSEYAQNSLYVQHDGFVPLNRAAFDQFVSTNAELSFINAQAMGAMQVLGEEEGRLAAFSTPLYSQVLAADSPHQDIEAFIEGYNG